MSRRTALFSLAVIFITASGASQAKAVDIVRTATTDGVRIELHVMDAEPFHTADEVKANPGLEGMLIVGGAKAVAMDAQPKPNCHLIVHLYDAQTGKALTDANVSMHFQLLDKDGKPQGPEQKVPVTVMQVIGKGPETTHYGNNVVLPDGTYTVTVMVDDKKTEFHIVVSSDANSASHE